MDIVSKRQEIIYIFLKSKWISNHIGCKGVKHIKSQKLSGEKEHNLNKRHL